jgi:hypothetical protein
VSIRSQTRGKVFIAEEIPGKEVGSGFGRKVLARESSFCRCASFPTLKISMSPIMEILA